MSKCPRACALYVVLEYVMEVCLNMNQTESNFSHHLYNWTLHGNWIKVITINFVCDFKDMASNRQVWTWNPLAADWASNNYLTNLYTNMAFSIFHTSGEINKENACESYDNSIKSLDVISDTYQIVITIKLHEFSKVLSYMKMKSKMW